MKSGLSIIIPNFNGSKYIKKCLDSLLKSLSFSSHKIFEIILVDNGSSDNSLEIFRKMTLNFNSKIIQNQRNYGFACAVNKGIKSSSYEYVCLLNNDIVIDRHWFQLVLQEIDLHQDSKIVVYCGSILNKQGSHFESQGLIFDYRGKCLNVNNHLSYSPLKINKAPHIIWGSSAALVIYQKSVITKLGLFDEQFFAYEEDVDLNLRLNLLHYQTLIIPKAISYHHGGGTSQSMGNLRQIEDAKNWILIILKNYPLYKILINLPNILIERLRNLSGLLKKTTSIYGWRTLYMSPYFIVKCYLPIIISLPQILIKRRQLQFLLKSINDNWH